MWSRPDQEAKKGVRLALELVGSQLVRTGVADQLDLDGDRNLAIRPEQTDCVQ